MPVNHALLGFAERGPHHDCGLTYAFGQSLGNDRTRRCALAHPALSARTATATATATATEKVRA
ncbi:hypothetical protein PV371_37975 [Streptomyces sp. TX20-6-3]|uniref:hypothetical protein n=1 Tax=Streptomyces sp. TX20-6-3 TaxID=3028705 RepID=UPI0029AD762A|nr:hypothetical protein [Streptomyces sp. TX20-6-3]MDX2565353.1 hypothetical protein [Streptomyces sp. TX20-6-3]